MKINITDRYNQTHTFIFQSRTVTVAEIYEATTKSAIDAGIQHGSIGWSVLLEAVKGFIASKLPNLVDSFEFYSTAKDQSI
jgi:hypothetical protein